MTPERFSQRCELCEQPLDTRSPGIHQFTMGWVEKRQAGGGHAISKPIRQNRWAHGPCVRATADEPEQLVLFS